MHGTPYLTFVCLVGASWFEVGRCFVEQALRALRGTLRRRSFPECYNPTNSNGTGLVRWRSHLHWLADVELQVD